MVTGKKTIFDTDEVLRLYEGGMSVAAIATKLQIGLHPVFDFLRAEGKIRKPVPPPPNKITRTKTNCKQCNREFEVWPSYLKLGWGKFCSKECAGLSMEKKVKCICLVCKDEFFVPPSHKGGERGAGKYCSRECQGIAFSGPGSPKWKGGPQKYCFKFNRRFKEHIREKFGRKCYLCETTEKENGRKLSVHHIDYNKNSICNGKEWAFVPLCDHHHAKSTADWHYYFNLLINYWAMNPEINFGI
jgi:hypothetical protein